MAGLHTTQIAWQPSSVSLLVISVSLGHASTVKVKPYSNGSMTRIERVTSVTSARIQALSLPSIKGYVSTI